MHSIHPSLYRRQILEYTIELSLAKQSGLPGEDAWVKERLSDFRARYAPWEGLYVDSPATIFKPRYPAVLVLEQIGQDYELYPSDAPWQTNLFINKEEALEFASKYYQGWEITQPSYSITPRDEIIQVFSELFCE